LVDLLLLADIVSDVICQGKSIYDLFWFLLEVVWLDGEGLFLDVIVYLREHLRVFVFVLTLTWVHF
jgi:hypothetical protein